MNESFELGREECERLLRSGITGRMALSSPTGPHIVPINYSVVGDAIIVRTSPYSLLGTYGRDTTLAFEVDQMDYEFQRGWSVVARGRGEIVTGAEELDELGRSMLHRPWASGNRLLHLRLRWTELTGRRIGEGWDPMEALPVRRTL